MHSCQQRRLRDATCSNDSFYRRLIRSFGDRHRQGAEFRSFGDQRGLLQPQNRLWSFSDQYSVLCQPQFGLLATRLRSFSDRNNRKHKFNQHTVRLINSRNYLTIFNIINSHRFLNYLIGKCKCSNEARPDTGGSLWTLIVMTLRCHDGIANCRIATLTY